MPKNTFTELLPVTFTMEASAHSSCFAAVLEAKRSGTEVPSATKEMAVISSSTPAVQPKSSARSLMMMVIQPMWSSDCQKQIQPPRKVGGGVLSAKMICQGNQIQCKILSQQPGSSSPLACTVIASLICSNHWSRPRRSSCTLTMVSNFLHHLDRRRLSPGFSLTMVTVRMHLSSPPSLSGLNSTPPAASSIISWKLSFTCPTTFGRTVTVIEAEQMPSLNCSSPESSSKS
mmetsp:Transcript_53851/g.166878  ORF Transcript_53851/g.166878 Transcript_53851/m.166878 type:complete len:231 (+) Transcript_53851:557-1249(+)